MSNLTRPILSFADLRVPTATVVQMNPDDLSLNIPQRVKRMMVTEVSMADNAAIGNANESFVGSLFGRWWVRGRPEPVIGRMILPVMGDPLLNAQVSWTPALATGFQWATCQWRPRESVVIKPNNTFYCEWVVPSVLDAGGGAAQTFYVTLDCHGEESREKRMLYQTVVTPGATGGALPGVADQIGLQTPGVDATNRFGENLIIDAVNVSNPQTVANGDTRYMNHIRMGIHIEPQSTWLTWQDPQRYPCLTGYGMEFGLAGRGVMIDFRDNPLELKGNEGLMFEFQNTAAPQNLRVQIIFEAAV